ncbi:type II secretion system GspH family protein [Patescibacteria group bacterium]|nr:type II secretion system GspH family protein [Patescibacteria group bacterium]
MESLSLRRGYSLIELLVVLGIIGIITVIAMVNQGTFNKTLILANTAYDVALTIRSAEGFGISSRFASSNPNVAFGLHFVRGNGNTSTFFIFADTAGGQSCNAGSLPTCRPGDGAYTDGADVRYQTYTLGNNITIDKFCDTDSGQCSTDAVNTLDISFARPNMVTTVVVNGDTSHKDTSACLRLTAPQGNSRYIKVSASGLINVNYTAPNNICQ